jgi:hypothetical protein
VESQHQFSAQCFTALVATTGKSLQVNPLKVTFPFNLLVERGAIPAQISLLLGRLRKEFD